MLAIAVVVDLSFWNQTFKFEPIRGEGRGLNNLPGLVIAGVTGFAITAAAEGLQLATISKVFLSSDMHARHGNCAG